MPGSAPPGGFAPSGEPASPAVPETPPQWYVPPSKAQSSVATGWNWVLGNSADLSAIGLLSAAQNRKINVALNDRESAGFTLSLLDPLAEQIEPINKCVLCYRNGKLVWSGPIYTLEKIIPDMIVNVGCLGWYEFVNHWLLKTGANFSTSQGTTYNTNSTTATTQSYNSTNLPNDQCAIAADLFMRAQIDAAQNLALFPLGLGAVPTNTQPRQITYQQYQNIGQAISALSNIEAGFDFHVDPVTRLFNIYYDPIWPVGGPYTVNGRGQVRPNAIFGYHWGPANIARLTETTDATSLINDAYAVSQYGTGAGFDAASQAQYGMFSEQLSVTDVAAIQTPVLKAYAQIE